MGWLTTLLQFLPTLIGLIPQILALWKAIQNAISHQAAAAANPAFAAANETQWWLYVPGQIAAGAVVSGAIITALQPRANAMARAWHDMAAQADLRSRFDEIQRQTATLPAEYQARLR